MRIGALDHTCARANGLAGVLPFEASKIIVEFCTFDGRQPHFVNVSVSSRNKLLSLVLPEVSASLAGHHLIHSSTSLAAASALNETSNAPAKRATERIGVALFGGAVLPCSRLIAFSVNHVAIEFAKR